MTLRLDPEATSEQMVAEPSAAPPDAVADVSAQERRWTRRYAATLVIEDVLCALAAVAIGWAARFGLSSDSKFGPYIALSVLFAVGWLICLQIAGAYELRKVSTGSRESQIVLRAAMMLAGSAAIIAYFSQLLIARTFIAIVIPLGALLQIAARLAVRRAVYVRRQRGEWTSAILAIGTRESVAHLIEVTKRNPFVGLTVVGACVGDAEIGSEIVPGVPVVGDVGDAAASAARIGADIVAVAGAGLGPRRIRELGWALEGTGRSMVLAPGLTEIAGPRVHVSPVEGLPLMWVEEPQFTGMSRVVKRVMDVSVSGLLLLLGAPFLLLIALAIRVTSRGPAIYRSTRNGVNGKLFTVYKFRSMYSDADERRAELLKQNEVEGGVLFKIRDDPRVTPVGRILRKFSLDELPQLLNVFGGTMSLVGPRPPLPDEVAAYNMHVHRRLLVKPGMTGLWQVSGRSDLSWDEAVRLDLYYVENWSLSVDLGIILRTVWVVLAGRGAY